MSGGGELSRALTGSDEHEIEVLEAARLFFSTMPWSDEKWQILAMCNRGVELPFCDDASYQYEAFPSDEEQLDANDPEVYADCVGGEAYLTTMRSIRSLWAMRLGYFVVFFASDVDREAASFRNSTVVDIRSLAHLAEGLRIPRA